MVEKLFIVEGASTSGKSALLEVLRERGFQVLRGFPSQHQEENLVLAPKAQQVLSDAETQFKEAMRLPLLQRVDLIRRCALATRLQTLEAARLKQSGHVVFLNRSSFSFMSLMELAAEKSTFRVLIPWFHSMVGLTAEMMLAGAEVDGLILMKRPYQRLSPSKQHSGVNGLEQRESALINSHVRSFAVRRKIPLLEIDPNITSLEEEIPQVETFVARICDPKSHLSL